MLPALRAKTTGPQMKLLPQSRPVRRASEAPMPVPPRKWPNIKESSLLATSVSNSSVSLSHGRMSCRLRRLLSRSQTARSTMRSFSRRRSGACMTLRTSCNQSVSSARLKCQTVASQLSNGSVLEASTRPFKRLKTWSMLLRKSSRSTTLKVVSHL